MLSHIVHTWWFDLSMITLTPVVLGVVLWRFCPEQPDNGFVHEQHREPGQDDEEDGAEVPLAA